MNRPLPRHASLVHEESRRLERTPPYTHTRAHTCTHFGGSETMLQFCNHVRSSQRFTLTSGSAVSFLYSSAEFLGLQVSLDAYLAAGYWKVRLVTWMFSSPIPARTSDDGRHFVRNCISDLCQSMGRHSCTFQIFLIVLNSLFGIVEFHHKIPNFSQVRQENLWGLIQQFPLRGQI